MHYWKQVGRLKSRLERENNIFKRLKHLYAYLVIQNRAKAQNPNSWLERANKDSGEATRASQDIKKLLNGIFKQIQVSP